MKHQKNINPHKQIILKNFERRPMAGMRKHRISGHTVSGEHFTGRGKKISRKNKSTRKQRQMKQGSHINKYKKLEVE